MDFFFLCSTNEVVIPSILNAIKDKQDVMLVPSTILGVQAIIGSSVAQRLASEHAISAHAWRLLATIKK